MEKFIITCTLSHVRTGGGSLFLADENLNFLKQCKYDFPEGLQGAVLVGDYIYVLGGDSLSKPYNDKIYVIDKNTFEVLDLRDELGYGAHGLWHHDGLLYGVFSEQCQVLVFDVKDLKVLGKIVHKSNRGIYSHVNSIYVDDDLTAITVHNTNNEGYVYAVGDYTGNRFPIVRNLSQPHDFRLIDNGYIVCNSAKKELIVGCCPIENSYKIQCFSYTRGVTEDKEFFYVGCSNREGSIGVAKISKLEKRFVEEYILAREFEGIEVCSELYSIICIN